MEVKGGEERQEVSTGEERSSKVTWRSPCGHHGHSLQGGKK